MKRAVRDQERTQRRYQRRRIKLPVTIRSDDGTVANGLASDISAGGLRFSTTAMLVAGSRGLAQISIPDGETVRAPVEIVWREDAPEDSSVYGIHFQNLGSSERFALFEAIYSPSNGEQVFLKSIDGAEIRPPGTEPLTPAHHAYYIRIVRRIEQAHKLQASDTDKLLYARLHEGRNLREAIVELGLSTDEGVDAFLSAVFGHPYIDLVRTRPDPNAAESIPISIATTGCIVPVKVVDDKLIVAMADPLDLPTLDLILLRAKHQVEIRFALIEDVEKAINDLYHGGTLQSVDRLLQGLPGITATGLSPDGSEVEDLETLRKMSDATPIVSLVESLLRTALEYRASDIHLEPYHDTVRVRFRLDGVLQEIRKLPRPVYPAVVSRIKIMARMDITIRHIPQDGRASMRYMKRETDLRIASLPTVNGEKVVIRLLEKNPAFKSLTALGFSDRNLKQFSPLINRPYGMILCCGPTGSGKSTTLFACLQEINDGLTNITTIEDPVEYRVGGVNQVEINVKRGLTFASVLRSLLRQDPDVIYVGEIRDRETADLAVRAALTGHLLLSTLHTNSAVQAITRLVDIGVDPALIGSSLIAVVGQRLVRQICPKCSYEYELEEDETLLLQELLPLVAPNTLHRGKGCRYCHDTGYYGRLGCHEVIAVDDGLRRLIARGADSNQLLDYVSAHGYEDLRDDALRRLTLGQTTLKEVVRVTI
ncbi:MAG: Flp pilus assembly complex ATPase component TadA [Candidatus Eremiobacteraeota bacterium]|nr:Flp pilus assembly complex ATPase component TadA [Candidatus Eremiobacteraeota bacterium]